MSKKAAKKALAKQQEEESQSSGAANFALAFVLSLVATSAVCVCICWLMSASYDMGTVFTLASAAVVALCYKRGQVSTKTVLVISILMGLFVGLAMGAFHIGHFFAVTDGALATFEDEGLKAAHLSSRFAAVANIRAFLIHLLFNTKYGMVFNISLAGIFDLFVSIAFYLYFMVFMCKRLRR